MAYEQRDNSGILFKNEQRPGKNDPVLTGKVMVGGALYYVSCWTKDGPKGKFWSLSFKPVEEKKPVSNDKDGFPEDWESDLPF